MIRAMFSSSNRRPKSAEAVQAWVYLDTGDLLAALRGS